MDGKDALGPVGQRRVVGDGQAGSMTQLVEQIEHPACGGAAERRGRTALAKRSVTIQTLWAT
ncbi:hypothetical protein [Nonomuraea sp. SYSU D8015]|uniref:hypothetical protein n=1 Tax=Nonomuraea sp. SYSU D8015 TaxID=2593644 RepID=UPI001660655E|nr:hypothetical protein [Nonomuraea sp. SYSU D8015]